MDTHSDNCECLPQIAVQDWGLRRYEDALAAQRELVRQRAQGEIPDTIIVTEHPPVLTLGRQGHRSNIVVSDTVLRARGIRVVSVERGGDVTYHGPGQLVVYPILRLPDYRRDVKAFIRNMEAAVVAACRSLGVPACTIKGLTGVWVSDGDTPQCHHADFSGERKIASIGFAFKRWVSYHGIALNVTCDLTPFSYINLCGLRGKQATSLVEVLKKAIDTEHVKRIVLGHIESEWRNFCYEYRKSKV